MDHSTQIKNNCRTSLSFAFCEIDIRPIANKTIHYSRRHTSLSSKRAGGPKHAKDIHKDLMACNRLWLAFALIFLALPLFLVVAANSCSRLFAVVLLLLAAAANFLIFSLLAGWVMQVAFEPLLLGIA
jgi:hypothetical protein